MVSRMMKLIYILMCEFVFVACDDDNVKGDSYAGKNSMECHIEGSSLKCVESNPYVSPVSGEFDKNEIFGDGEIVEFKWDETIPWYLLSSQHKYGFDLDPYSLLPDFFERGENVYVSVKKREFAHVRIRVDPKMKAEYHLDKIDGEKKEEIITGHEICEEDKCIKDVVLSSGEYAAYYGNKDVKRYLHVIEFDEKIKNVLFVQFGDVNGSTCLYSSNNGCYTYDVAEAYCNKIYKQAVVKGVFTPKSAEDVGMDELLVVDLTNEESVLLKMNSYNEIIRLKLYPEYKRIFEEYVDIAKRLDDAKLAYEKKKKDYEECLERYHGGTYACPYDRNGRWNMERKIDMLQEKKNETYNKFKKIFSSVETKNHHVVLGINEMRIKWDLLDNSARNLKNFRDFNMACTIYHAREYNDGCLNLRFPMYLRSSCGGIDKEIEVEMFANDKAKNIFSLNLYGTGMLDDYCDYSIYADVHPFVPGMPSAVQYTLVNYKSDYDHTVVGGLVWGSHVAGKSSYNALCHEIAHSYGLSDLYVQEFDPTIFEDVASYETNLMNNKTPIGSKIRYRPLEVTSTSTNERIKVKSGKFATENQWECLRLSENCFKQ